MLKRISAQTNWENISFPSRTRPVPLDEKLRPLDPEVFRNVEKNSPQLFFVAPAASMLSPNLDELVLPYLESRPDVGIFYGDDAVMQKGGGVDEAYCKPVFNKALFFADDYIGFPLLIRSSTFSAIQYEAGRDPEGSWYQFCLSAMRAGVPIDRIPHTLAAFWTTRPKAPVKIREKIVRAALAADNQPFTIEQGATQQTSRMRRVFRRGYPPVTLVIPTRQAAAEASSGESKPHIVNLLDSLGKITWPSAKLEVLIGDDNPDDTVYRGRNDRFSVRRIVTTREKGEPFNYAAKMNNLWRQAQTEHMVLMNDDVIARSPDWLESLFTHAMEEDVGGVGGRLLYPDGTIQHAGMFGGIYEVCAHPWYLKPQNAKTYCDWAIVQRDCTVVTGALFATRRSVMEAVNGFDEAFTLDFNDVDLCLKMRMLGYRIIYEPFAEMFHHEKGSRGVNFAPGNQVDLFLARWKDFLVDDPMFSPQLRIDTDDVTPLPAASRLSRR
jgi:O-antigen biosynthesis protein